MRPVAKSMLGLLLMCAAQPCLAARDRAQTGEQQLAEIIGDRIAGTPVRCIQTQDIRSNRIVSGTAIIYEGTGGRLYVNRPEGGADRLRSDDILVTRTFGGQLCNVDIVRLVEPGTRFDHGFVGLSTFVPYDRPKTKRSHG